MILIYTDGSCLSNPGPGGWAAIILDGESKMILKGGEKNTTNNRMEMMAVISGLESVAISDDIVGGLFRIDGDSSSKKTRVHVGSGSLKKFSGAAESITYNPEDRKSPILK